VGGTSNQGLVVRVGDTVRRPRRPTGAATYALLDHLTDVGFDGAPKFLGIDERDREVLSFVSGEAVTLPYPAWALTEEALVSVAQLLRRYHDAVASFDPSGHVWGKPVPAAFRTDLVSHNDPNLDNVVFRDRQAVALIDFDLAGPGSRVWDVAGAARLWAPLRFDADITDARLGHALSRFRVFVDAYGPTEVDRERMVSAVRHHHSWCYDIVRSSVDRGHTAFTKHWAGGGSARAERTEQFYRMSELLMRAALR